MTNIMIVGANGAMAQLLTTRLLQETEDHLTLYLRQASRLARYQDNARVTLVEGDATDTSALAQAMTGIDVVYSNLGGSDLADQTKHVLAAMKQTGVTRFIYISSLGTHNEVPGKYGEWNEQTIGAYLPDFREASEAVMTSGVSYTEIRPAWLTDNDEIDYEETQLGEDFKGTEVSRQSVVDFALRVIQAPETYRKTSVGLDKAGTDGDKPSWY